jgi:membrane protease subunit HflK
MAAAMAAAPDLKGAGITAGVAAVVVVLIWAGQRLLHRAGGQTGVVSPSAKSATPPAGFNWRWPYPFQSDETVKVSQMRTVEIGYRGNAQQAGARIADADR